MANQKVSVSLDDFLSDSAIGPLATAIGNNIYGINHRQEASPILSNKDQFGFTFFTRPQLNFQTANIRNSRILTPLLSNNPTSYPTITRCTLDPRIMYGYGNNVAGIDCTFVDPQQAFIPILTNHLKAISGWPDITSPTHVTKEGKYQQSHAMVDGIVANYKAYDIEATFRNSRGDLIMSMFHAWVNYQSLVFEGKLNPYMDYILANAIDYNTRIYRLVLDSNKRKVQKIACTGASFPTSLPVGASFDYNNEKPYNDANADISIRFQCLGFQYQDPIIIDEFNKTVQIFNRSMKEDTISSSMVEIPVEMLRIFNNRGYPRIDPLTYELSWFVSTTDYNNKLVALRSYKEKLGI